MRQIIIDKTRIITIYKWIPFNESMELIIIEFSCFSNQKKKFFFLLSYQDKTAVLYIYCTECYKFLLVCSQSMTNLCNIKEKRETENKIKWNFFFVFVLIDHHRSCCRCCCHWQMPITSTNNLSSNFQCSKWEKINK